MNPSISENTNSTSVEQMPPPPAQPPAPFHASPVMDASSLDHALFDSDWKVRRAAASNPNATPSNIERALWDEHRLVRRAAMLNPAAPASHIEHSLNGTDQWMRRSAAGNPSVTKEQLDRALNDPHRMVRRAAAGNPTATPEQLHDAFFDDGDWVRRAAASNPSASEIQIEWALNDEHPMVRRAAVLNPSASDGQLIRALTDEEWEVREAAAGNPSDAGAPALASSPSGEAQWATTGLAMFAAAMVLTIVVFAPIFFFFSGSDAAEPIQVTEPVTFEEPVLPEPVATTPPTTQAPAPTTEAPAATTELLDEAVFLTDPFEQWTGAPLFFSDSRVQGICGGDSIVATVREGGSAGDHFDHTPEEFLVYWAAVQERLTGSDWEVTTSKQIWDGGEFEMWLLYAAKEDHGVHLLAPIRPTSPTFGINTELQVFSGNCVEAHGVDLMEQMLWYNEPTNRPLDDVLPDFLEG